MASIRLSFPTPRASSPASSRCSEHGPISHCAAHHVTHAFSLAEKAGKGRAKRTPNQWSRPTLPSGAPGGQFGNSERSTRREAARAVSAVLSAPASSRDREIIDSYRLARSPSFQAPTFLRSLSLSPSLLDLSASSVIACRNLLSRRPSSRGPSGPLDSPARHLYRSSARAGGHTGRGRNVGSRAEESSSAVESIALHAARRPPPRPRF
eukprot:scaffold310358_cov28-Tisochrysis_lutea.AAC.2